MISWEPCVAEISDSWVEGTVLQPTTFRGFVGLNSLPSPPKKKQKKIIKLIIIIIIIIILIIIIMIMMMITQQRNPAPSPSFSRSQERAEI